jgi:hypothetical protein
MAQLVLAVAGAAIGYGITATAAGASYGWMAGTILGAAFAPDQNITGPRLEDLTVSSSAYGAAIPYLQGTMRISGQLIWASEKREIVTVTEVGGKGGSTTQTTYTYEADLHFLLTDVEIHDVTRIWSNGKLIYNKTDGAVNTSVDASDNTSTWSRVTVYTGAADQMPDPDGHPDAPAYRGRGSIFFKSYGLGNSGFLPNLTFEVLTQGASSGSMWTVSSFGIKGFGAKAGGTVKFIPPPVGYYFEFAMVYNPVTNNFWVAGYYEDTSPFQILVWEVNKDTGAVISTVDLGTNPIYNIPAWMCISPDGGTVYFLITDYPFVVAINTVTKAWSDFAPIPPVTPGDDPFFWKMYLNHAGTRLVVPFGDWYTGNSMHIYDTATGTLLNTVFITTASNDAGQGRFTSDDRFLFFGCNSLWRIDMVTYAVTEAWVGNSSLERTASDLIFSVDGLKAYLGMVYDNKVIEFNVTTVASPPSVTLTEVATYVNPTVPSYMQFMEMATDGINIFIVDADYGNYYRFDTQTKLFTIISKDKEFCIPSQPIAFPEGLSAPADPTLREVVEDLCQRAGLTPTQYDASDLDSLGKKVHGLVSGQLTSVRVLLEQLGTAYFFDCHLSDKLYFRHRGQAAAATIPYTEMSASDGQNDSHDPMPLTQVDELEIPSKFALTYTCSERDYQTDTQYSDRLVRTQDNTKAVQLPLSFTASEAKAIADTLLLNQVLAALQVTISLPRKYYAYEPDDVLRLVDRDGLNYDMRMVSRKETDGVLTFKGVKEDASVLVQAGAVSAIVDGTQTTVLAPDTTLLRVLNSLPSVLDVYADQIGEYVAVGSDVTDWNGCTLFEDNSVSPKQLARFTQRTVMGQSQTTLENWTKGDVMDQINTVDIVLTAADSLSSVTRADLLKDPTLNLAVLRYEVLQFQTAELIAPQTYRLSNLLRYRNNSEFAIGYPAIYYSLFTLLQTNGGVQFIPETLASLGLTKTWVAVSANQKYSDGTFVDADTYSFHLRCLAPVHLHKDVSETDGAITIQWLRCTRLETRFVGPLIPVAPLGEASESYVIEIFTDAGYATIKRTLTASTNSAPYTAAQQITDFGALQQFLYVKIYQVSATVGKGQPAKAKI